MNRLNLLRNLLLFFTLLIVFMFSLSLMNDQKEKVNSNEEISNAGHIKASKMFEHRH